MLKVRKIFDLLPSPFICMFPMWMRPLKKAAAAGGEVPMPVMDMFWGDRVGQIKDPFGYLWSVATHTQDLTSEQVQEGAKKFFKQMSQKQ